MPDTPLDNDLVARILDNLKVEPSNSAKCSLKAPGTYGLRKP
jgi:hypothetical protein